ncbi:MAG: hypothetical protein IJC19_03630 [Clostridia bacterium]|nr:hypothetical protein [Clostridia bacterium]
MLFSEKMARVPQPRRADLWSEYRVLCTALSLQVRRKKEGRNPSEEELIPLKNAAKRANDILLEQGMEISFFPENESFFDALVTELTAIMNTPSDKD